MKPASAQSRVPTPPRPRPAAADLALAAKSAAARLPSPPEAAAGPRARAQARATKAAAAALAADTPVAPERQARDQAATPTETAVAALGGSLRDAPDDAETRPPQSGGMAACMARIRARGFSVAAVPDHGNPRSCGYRDAVSVTSGRIGLSDPLLLTCAMADRFTAYVVEVMDPAARSTLGSPIEALHQVGGYQCRNINRARRGRLSSHAEARAVDFGAVRLADGRRIAVTTDYRSRGSAGAFLRQIEAKGCAYFNTVLTPASDAAHQTHYHLDIRAPGTCDRPLRLSSARR